MQQSKRKAIYAAIHIKKASMCFSDDIYRSILFDNFKQSSAKDLSDSQLIELLNVLDYIQSGKPIQPAHMINGAQLSYLNDLCYRNKIISSTAYISKIIHREIVDIKELTKVEAGKVIRSLQAMNRRKSTKPKEVR